MTKEIRLEFCFLIEMVKMHFRYLQKSPSKAHIGFKMVLFRDKTQAVFINSNLKVTVLFKTTLNLA